MKIKSNKINSANAEIKATVSKEILDANLEKIAKELAKTAKIDGFRKGKVPTHAVKKQYGEKLVQDAEAEALREILKKGLKELAITNESLIGEPNVTQFDKNDDKIEITVKIAMKPTIELGDYASIIQDFDKPTVSVKEINAKIREIASAQATLVDVKEDRELVSGDTALIDFEGSVDGELFEGGAAKDFALELGSGQFIPGFEDQVIGMKKGEEKIAKVTFPENYGGEKLSGKDAEFKVNVKAIQAKEKIVVNEKLAKKLLKDQEDTSLENLKAQIKAKLENEKLSKLYNEDLKPALLKAFVENFTFDLPDFVVDQEIDVTLNKKAGEMSEDEIKELRENADKLNELRETFREDAQKSVKATFIIDSLAQAEKVKVDEQEVMQAVYFEAMQTKQDPKKAYEHYKENGYIPAIQMSMVEDKVLTQLLNLKIKEA